MNALEQISFPETARRLNATYQKEEDALLIGMLGQEYVVRHEGVFLLGQHAPENHATVISDYVVSKGSTLTLTPWRSMSDFNGSSSLQLRKMVEAPLAGYVGDIITRANAMLPMIAADVAPSIFGSDMAINVRALPNVYLHVELSQETPDFPAETWILFSKNANEFVTPASAELLAEIFKDRLVSLLRIY